MNNRSKRYGFGDNCKGIHFVEADSRKSDYLIFVDVAERYDRDSDFVYRHRQSEVTVSVPRYESERAQKRAWTMAWGKVHAKVMPPLVEQYVAASLAWLAQNKHEADLLLANWRRKTADERKRISKAKVIPTRALLARWCSTLGLPYVTKATVKAELLAEARRVRNAVVMAEHPDRNSNGSAERLTTVQDAFEGVRAWAGGQDLEEAQRAKTDEEQRRQDVARNYDKNRYAEAARAERVRNAERQRRWRQAHREQATAERRARRQGNRNVETQDAA